MTGDPILHERLEGESFGTLLLGVLEPLADRALVVSAGLERSGLLFCLFGAALKPANLVPDPRGLGVPVFPARSAAEASTATGDRLGDRAGALWAAVDHGHSVGEQQRALVALSIIPRVLAGF